MEYKDLLATYIKKSKMTLDQIAEECKKYNLNIHPTYISKLRLGKRAPASYEVSAVLAKVLGGEPEKLIAASKNAENEIKSKELEDALKLIYPNIEKTEIIDKEYLINKIWREETFKELGIEISEKNDYLPIITVPVLGYISAGNPIMAVEHIEEWTDIPNMWKLKDDEVFILKVKGDSMIGSRIFEGDKVIVKIQQNVENGEIAVVNVNGEDATLKRVKKINGQVILYPDNPKYEPIFIKNENARIIGKVIQVMFEPKRI